MNDKKKRLISTILCCVLFAIFLLSVLMTSNSLNEPKEVTYQEFLEMVEDKKVDTVTIDLKNGDVFLFTDFKYFFINLIINLAEFPKYGTQSRPWILLTDFKYLIIS